jgi:hypothetical protein
MKEGMKRRRVAMVMLTVALLGVSTALSVNGVDPIALFGGSLLILFFVYMAMEMPRKHKDFTYSDQLKGMLQSYGGNAPPEIQNPEELEKEHTKNLPNQAL